MKRTFTFLVLLLAFFGANINAQTDLIISEYGEGWGSNKYIELFNPTNQSINVKDYQIVRYSNGGQTKTDDYTISLPDFNLEPYKAFVITQDKRESAGTVPADGSPIWSQLEARGDYFAPSNYGTGPGTKCVHWSGDDAVVLHKVSGEIVDIFGEVGVRPAEATMVGSTNKAKAWTDTPDYDNGIGLALSVDHSLFRLPSVKNGVTTNPEHFNILAEYDSLPANTFTNLGWHKFDGAPANAIPVFDMESLYAVSPLAEEGEVALTLKATDADAGQNMEYYIISGNFIYVGEGDDAVRQEPFKLNKTTGELTVANEEALAEATEDIYFNVVACDEYGQSEIFSFDVRVTETDLGISETRSIDVTLSPNPARNYFVVSSDKNINSVQVLSLNGQELYYQSGNQRNLRVDLALPSGSYIVKTTFDGNGVGINKLIVK